MDSINVYGQTRSLNLEIMLKAIVTLPGIFTGSTSWYKDDGKISTVPSLISLLFFVS